MERGTQRFRELIIYISAKSVHDVHFGAVKLNKVLYYSDFSAFKKFGIPLTGRVYFRLPQGPAPRALLPIRSELEREGAIRIDKISLGNGIRQDRTIALRAPVLELFTADEIALVDAVIEQLWDQTATQVSDASHDVRWKVLQDRDFLPYEFAYLESGAVSKAELQRTEELAEKLGW